MSSAPDASAPSGYVPAPWSRFGGRILLATSFALAAPVFVMGFQSLVAAWGTPEYSHGPLIPLISLFLFLREMRAVPSVVRPVTDRWPGFAVIALGLTVGVLGNVVKIPDIITYGFIVWLTGLTLVCFGFRRGVLFWPALLHLVFMLPLPQFVYWQVSIYLQMVSSQIGVALIQLFSIPVYLDGNIIDLGVYKLQVAEACSGLRYLFPMLSFSYVFAVLYQGPRWHKAILLLAAAPITVLMNSFRIGMIGVLVDSYGIEQAEGFLHSFEGWVIFLACVSILFLMAMGMQQMSRNPRRLSETLDIEFDGLGGQLRRADHITASPALIAALALTAAVALGSVAVPTRQAVFVEREPLILFPNRIADWSGVSQQLESNIEAVLGADDYFLASYSSQEHAAPVDFFVAYYDRQTEGSGIHSPEVCIPAGGWEVSNWEPRRIELDNGMSFEVNRAIIQKGVNRQIVYYWFEQRGRRLVSDYAVKMVTVMDAIRTGRTDGGLVRVISPVAPNEAPEAADLRLQSFLNDAMPALSAYVPE